MFKSTRKLKNKKSSPISNLIVPLIIFLVSLAVVVFAYQISLYFNNRSFISPVPFVLQKTEAKKADGNTAANNLEALLKKNNINFSSVEKGNSTLTVKLTSGEEVLFSEDKLLETQISSLQLILSRLTIEGKRFDRIDFRFDKPIIQFR